MAGSNRLVMILIAAAMLSLELAAAEPRGPQPLPVKLLLLAETNSIAKGAPLKFKCLIKDAHNQLVPAPFDLPVLLEGRSPAGLVTQLNLTIQKGNTEAEASLNLSQLGILEFRAAHTNLRNDTTFIKIRPSPTNQLMRAPAVPRNRHSEPGSTGRQPGLSPSPAAPRSSPPDSFRVEARTLSSPVISPAAAPPSPPEESPAARPPLSLQWFCPQDSFLADGEEAARISAFLTGEANPGPEDIIIIFQNERGQMVPIPLVFPMGQDSAQAELTSRESGQVKIAYVKSQPGVTLESPKEQFIRFKAPIAKLQVDLSPSHVTLLSETEVVVRLLDKAGRPVAADESKKVSLHCDGAGQLGTTTLTISEGTAEERTRFIPERRGRVTIQASLADYFPQSVTFMVVFPALLIGMILAGGAIGGGMSAWAHKAKEATNWWKAGRIAMGLVTAYLLYYFALLGFLEGVPRQLALNPFCALAVSIVGGWLGTEVFGIILKRFGFGQETPPPEPA